MTKFLKQIIKFNYKISLFFVIWAIIFCEITAGQDNPYVTKKLVKSAEENMLIGDYRTALNQYIRLLNLQPENPEFNYFVGLCYLETGIDDTLAIAYFEKALKFGSKRIPAILYYYLGKAYHFTNRLDEAIAQYEFYLLTAKMNLLDKLDAERQIIMCKNAKILMQYPVKVNIVNIGNVINSSFSDYSPLTNADGTTLIFTSRKKGSVGGYIDINGEFCSDIYISNFKNNMWLKPKSIGSIINTENNEIGVGLSNNGSQLLISRDDFLTQNIKLFISRLQGKSFGKPVPLSEELKTENDISTKYVEATGCFSEDCNIIFFSSNRKGGFGALDIWQISKKSDDTWGTATNVGNLINTPFNDEAPFVSFDGKTIYFSSKGHNSIGSYDIFKSTQDETGNWTKAVNLGYPINSTGDDMYISFTKDGRLCYFSSNRTGGLGALDIYMFEMLEK